MDEREARNELVEVCRLAYSRGYICSTEGNFSIRLSDERILSTPRGTCKGRITPGDLVLTDLDGHLLTGQQAVRSTERSGRSPAADEAAGLGPRPSTELEMHLTAYRVRPDINAVVHAHPTTAVAFTVAGVSLNKCVLPEVVCTLGAVPTAPYATPSTGEVGQSIREIVRENDALMLDHHGALTVGRDIWEAFYKLETLEHYAQTMLVAHLLGGVKPLLSSQVKKLLAIRGVYGLTRPLPVELLTGRECSQPDPEISS